MSNRKNFFATAFDAMVAARSRQANAYVNGALLMLDDKTLAEHGYDRKQLKSRASAVFPL